MRLKSALVLSTIGIAGCMQSAPEKEKPNIIYILADDLGYAELGSYGQQKIETPHIDQLASNGVRFTQHYSGLPVCLLHQKIYLQPGKSVQKVSLLLARQLIKSN